MVSRACQETKLNSKFEIMQLSLLLLIWRSVLLQVAFIIPFESVSSTSYSLLNAWQWSSKDNVNEELYVNSAFYSQTNNALILTGNNNHLPGGLKKRKSSDCFLAQITMDQGLLEWSRVYRTNYNDACSASTPASTMTTSNNYGSSNTSSSSNSSSIYAFGFTSSQSFTSSINSTVLCGFGFLATPLLDLPVTNLSLSLGLATSSTDTTDTTFTLNSDITTTAMPRTSAVNNTTTSSSPRPGTVLDAFQVNYPVVAETFQNGDILVASLVSNYKDITSNLMTPDSGMTDLPLGKNFKILLQRLSAVNFHKQWTRVISTTEDSYSAFLSDLRIAINKNGQEIIIIAGTTAGYGDGLSSSSGTTDRSTNLTSTLQADYDGFVTKIYGDTGAFVPQGSRRISSNLLGSEDRISGLCVHPPSSNSSGYIYVIGTTDGLFITEKKNHSSSSSSSSSTSASSTTSTTQHSAFIQQLDFETMNTLWVRQISPSNNNTNVEVQKQMQQTDASGVGCVVSPDGKTVFASGIISNGGYLPNQTSFGGDDLWIASYQVGGLPNFVLQIGSDKQDSLAKHNSILLDSDGRLLLIGTTLGDLTLSKQIITSKNDISFDTTSNRTVSKAFVLQYGEQLATESTTSAVDNNAMDDDEATNSATFVLLTMPPSPTPLIKVQGEGSFSAIRSNNNNTDEITESPIQTSKANSKTSSFGVAALVAVILVASFVGVFTLRKIWKKREQQTRMTQRKEDEIIMYHGDDLAPRRSSSYNFGTIHHEDGIHNKGINQYCGNEPNANTSFPEKPNDFSIMPDDAAISTTPDENNESKYELNEEYEHANDGDDTFDILRASSSSRLGFL